MSSAVWKNPFTGGSGSSLVINNNHFFADNNERDVYFSSHLDELEIGLLIGVGTGFQQWNGTQWIDKTAVVRGPKGNKGDKGVDGNNNYLGIFNNILDLMTAHPSPNDDDIAIILTTNSLWFWNEILSEWIDTKKGGIGDGVSGAVFITDVVPTSSGNVGDKVKSSDGIVLDSCSSDTQNITVSVLAITGPSNYKPNVTVNSIPVSLIAQTDAPIFKGTINIVLSGETEIVAEHEDGAIHTCQISSDAPPIIQSAIFTGSYPAGQTELKENDTFGFRVITDIPYNRIEIADLYACKSLSQSVPLNTTNNITVTIANRGNTAQLQGARVRVQKPSGSWSNWYNTTTGGSVNGVNVVNINNLHPTITLSPIAYPTGQQALKGSEQAIINHTVTNFDTITYTNPTGQISIPNTTTYEPAKTVTRVSGDYNITNDNFRIEAKRTANGATRVQNAVVFIANVAPLINITLPSARLRSGGNNGTSAQDYNVTITSNQKLLNAPTLLLGASGSWLGAGFTTSDYIVFTRQIRVHDNDVKGSYSFNSLVATNLAGVVTNTITSGASYVLGGFVSRNITLLAFENESIMNVEATDYNKVTLSWSFKPSLVNRYPVNTAPPIVDGWCLTALNSNPTTIRLLDTATTASSSQNTIITVEETI